MDSTISDLKQREAALDPTQSFIVQAPAGSGKTSLLVQRYLTLLSTAKAPEEIVAITFTRKAAFEMRDRIINALKKAAKEDSAQNQYEATTQNIALAALKQNQIKNWNIIQNPSRLRIQTIDSFCNYLVKRTPILTKFRADAKIIQNQDADLCYREAAQAILASSVEPQYANYLETLLLHLDNDWHLAERLFITMLKSREQWLPHVAGLRNAKELRQNMEQALKTIAQENQESCVESFPKELKQEFRLLLSFSKDNHEKSPVFLQEINLENDFGAINLIGWQEMAKFLLTKEYAWRKKITKEHGFPAQTSGSNKEEKELFKSMKTRMEELLINLREHEDFRVSLENLACSPPTHYDNQQWEIIEALLELLPLLAAQLKVIFNEQGVTDYAEVSMAALHALGHSDLPSELALNLDYHLQHLLIDEFQDTSVAQYKLVEKLTSSWQQDDGHTLFVVGDPMQSIYRFREAEVGLFLRTQHEGIGMLRLQSISLTTNFRSYENIVNWINNNFSKIFPAIADIGFGAVPFRQFVATKQDQNSEIKIELLKDANTTAEAAHVINTVHKLQQQDPKTSIAILVKARSHLQKITATMRKANLDFQAYELETLGESVVVRDLFALTRALFHPADRIAWLAIMRAPWCGLNLKDLHTLANGKSELVWDNVCNHHELELTTDGKELIKKFKLALTPIFAQRGRILWRDLIEEAWLALGGPATVTDESELEYAKIYLEILATNSLDIKLIQKKLSVLYAPSPQTSNIKIMTIHKAKGLEFDHVILPGIDRITRFDERKLMLWLQRPELHGNSSLLLAPLNASGNQIDPVYRYLKLVEQKKGFYETARLLYVALTRAKKSAHIIGCIKQAKEKKHIINNIQENSLLKQLQPCFDESWITDEFKDTGIDIANNQIKPTGTLQRLSKDWLTPITVFTSQANISPDWQLTDNQAAVSGTVIHHCLRQASESNLENLDDEYFKTQKPYWQKLLLQLGYIDIDYGTKLISEAIKLTLANKRGRWILEKHENAENELAITTKINGKLENFIIDRTFIDNDNTRWIIDYKTSKPNSGVAEFLSQEKAKYAPQLIHYAKLMHELDPTRQIKLGLYFPLCSSWIEMYE
jgi:ATP-dependent helicase/nuclease subunit A